MSDPRSQIADLEFRAADIRSRCLRTTSSCPTSFSSFSLSCLKSSILSAVDRANIVIIGGGVVGCAVARAVSQRWSDVFLVEQMPRFGMGASTRNSGVIHSGIYYPPGSLKANLCVAGNRMLHEFCAAHNVPHTGIAANSSWLTGARRKSKLEHLAENGSANGVEGLRLIDPRRDPGAPEPHIEATAALEVPSTGIVSAEDLVKTLARALPPIKEQACCHARVSRASPHAQIPLLLR